MGRRSRRWCRMPGRNFEETPCPNSSPAPASRAPSARRS
jgi:hypothetical protein